MECLLSKQLEPGIDFFINQLPGYILIKDMNSVYLKGCKKVTKLFGLKSTNEVIGLTDYSVKHEVAQYGDLFVHQDNRLKLLGKSINGFYVVFYDGMQRPTFFNKTFLRDELGNNIGILAQCVEVEDNHVSNHLNNLLKIDPIKNSSKHKKVANYFLNSQYDGINLSNRESQCLFYLLRGKSAAIAQILHLSTRTIETYIEQLKYKMACDNKAQLIEKAIESGYIEILPPGVITKLEAI